MANSQVKGAENGLTHQEDNYLGTSISYNLDHLTVRELESIAENWIFAEDDPDIQCAEIDEELDLLNSPNCDNENNDEVEVFFWIQTQQSILS